jgi:hypothetical protein
VKRSTTAVEEPALSLPKGPHFSLQHRRPVLAFSSIAAFQFSTASELRKILITKVTFTLNQRFSNIHLVVWQFWGRAAEASWAAKSEALFFALHFPIHQLTGRTDA